MGEIRSTMDIIMERTKGLTMSDEEKRRFREGEMSGRIRGLVQRGMDKTLDMERLKVELAALQEKDREMADRLIGEEFLSRIEPGGDNEFLLNCLSEILGLDTSSLRDKLQTFAHTLEKERTAREAVLRERLEARGVSGSSVLPNPEADPEWVRYVEGMKQSLKRKLTHE